MKIQAALYNFQSGEKIKLFKINRQKQERASYNPRINLDMNCSDMPYPVIHEDFLSLLLVSLTDFGYAHLIHEIVIQIISDEFFKKINVIINFHCISSLNEVIFPS